LDVRWNDEHDAVLASMIVNTAMGITRVMTRLIG
jgi:hypothetical protein